MAITFLRHATLPKSEQKKYHGWNDISIDEGLFEELKVKELKKSKFDLVISSDLVRCTQTLDKIGLKYKIDKRLREVRFNEEIEGKYFEDIETLKSYFSEYLHSKSSWHNYVCRESKEEFEDRLRDFLNSLPKANILICSHKGAIVEMLSILGYDIQNIDYLEHIRIKNELQ